MEEELHSEYLTNDAFEGSGDFRMGALVIRTVNYADDLVLLAKEETELQDMIDRLIEILRHDGIQMNVRKTR
jgi:hypothetical protein